VISRVVASLTLALCCLLSGWGPRAAQARLDPTSVASADAREDIRDIHGPLPASGRHPAWWYFAGAGAIAGATVGFVAYTRRRMRRAPPHVRALRALVDLRASPGSGARTFSFAVSEIIRLYVEEAFNVRAAHRTTEELLADLMLDTSPVAAHRTAIGEFLRHCDLAKFGGWSLSEAEMAVLLASAEAFVVATAPAPGRRHARATAVRGEGVA
jgi:hypothetical protein